MSVDLSTIAPESAPSDGRRGPGPKSGRSRSAGSKTPLVVGGQPRANLLPPEIVLKRTQLKTRRTLRAGVLLVAVATAAGCFLTFGVASVAQVQLTAAEQTQQDLVTEQNKYQGVLELQHTIDRIEAGQQVGGSTEINWRSYMQLLEATLPAGVVLDTVSIESGTPMVAFGQSSAPLQGERVAALSFSVTSPTLPSIPDWLRSMASLPGFVDAIPGSVQGEEGSYRVDVILHVNSEAFSMRFGPDNIAEGSAAGDSTDETASEEATAEEGN